MLWKTEPDHIEISHAGLDCIVHRTTWSGCLCGYVGLPADHPLYGVGYDQEHPALAQRAGARADEPIGTMSPMLVLLAAVKGEIAIEPRMALAVHGGLSYSGFWRMSGDRTTARWSSGRMVDPGYARRWWFGFDCGHHGDITPANAERYGWHDGIYRDIEYVIAETRSLAEQLAAVA
jgi:hypothetical protein